MTCCMRSPSIRIGGAWQFSRIEFANPRVMRSPTNTRMRARPASSSGSPGSTNPGARPLSVDHGPQHAGARSRSRPSMSAARALGTIWSPRPLLQGIWQAHGRRRRGPRPNKCAPEPTPGIEPETSFLPAISLPALWHPGDDPERNASDYGVARFGWSRYPWLGRPSGSQLTRMIRDLPSAITKAIGFAPQREDSTLERAAQQTGDASTVLDTN